MMIQYLNTLHISIWIKLIYTQKLQDNGYHSSSDYAIVADDYSSGQNRFKSAKYSHRVINYYIINYYIINCYISNYYIINY